MHTHSPHIHRDTKVRCTHTQPHILQLAKTHFCVPTQACTHTHTHTNTHTHTHTRALSLTLTRTHRHKHTHTHTHSYVTTDVCPNRTERENLRRWGGVHTGVT